MSPGRVRISGGDLKGRRVQVPKTARPTEGRVREALFSIWQQELPGSRFLDLFAGSGVVAAEAASRGALGVVAVERHGPTYRQLETNRSRLGLQGIVEVHLESAPALLYRWAAEGSGVTFHLIFADPPYAYQQYEELLRAAEPVLAEGGQIAIEHSSRVELPLEVPTNGRPLVRVDSRRYGESVLSFYRRLAA